MTVTPLVPDQPLDPSLGANVATPASQDDAGLFSGLVDGFRETSNALESASRAESAFANGTGDVQEMVFERARADALLSIASAGASKATQSLNTILNMQV